MQIISDLFTTIECHDMRVDEIEIGKNFIDDQVKERISADQTLWSAKILISDIDKVIVKTNYNKHLKFCNELSEPLEKSINRKSREPDIGNERYHDIDDPQCSICKAIKKAGLPFGSPVAQLMKGNDERSNLL